MRPLIVVVLVSSLAVSSCGDNSPQLVFPAVAEKVPDPASTGKIAGRVLYAGAPVTPRELAAPDGACARSGHKIVDESYIVENGGLGNVLVHVTKGAEGWKFSIPTTEYEVDQEGCVFAPHVAAVRTHQPVRFANSDNIVHNVNSPGVRGFPFGITPAQKSQVRQFTKAAIGMRVTCDLHANMLMWVHVLDHPFFAVTAPDGSFEIGGLPPGDYELTTWHERGGEKTTRVTLNAAGETASAVVSY